MLRVPINRCYVSRNQCDRITMASIRHTIHNTFTERVRFCGCMYLSNVYANMLFTSLTPSLSLTIYMSISISRITLRPCVNALHISKRRQSSRNSLIVWTIARLDIIVALAPTTATQRSYNFRMVFSAQPVSILHQKQPATRSVDFRTQRVQSEWHRNGNYGIDVYDRKCVIKSQSVANCP